MKSLLILSASLLFLACKGEPDDNSPADSGPADSGPVDISSNIIIETSMGAIKIKLHSETAPITVANFLDTLIKNTLTERFSTASCPTL